MALFGINRHCALLLALCLVLFTLWTPLEPVAAAPVRASLICNQVTAVPISECEALVEIYEATDGSNWRNPGGWLTNSSAASPCDWQGIGCENGQVAELILPQNRLSGTLPRSLSRLPALRRLNLAGNQLRGPVPPAICDLAGRVSVATLGYNALWTRRTDLRMCLNQIDPSWAATQTSAPRQLLPVAFETTAVQLSWQPIAYVDDGGFYEVGYATDPDGPFISHGQTPDKRTGSYRLDGLLPGTTYFVRVRTYTPAHAAQPDELRSDEVRTVVVTRSARTILLAVYLPADNDLSPYIAGIRERLRLGSQLNPNIRIVLLSDGAAHGDTRVVQIANGQVEPTNAVVERWGRNELDTASPEVLAWFLRYARDAVPAEHEIVSLMGHGNALVPEVAWPESSTSRASVQRQAGRFPALPKGATATPSDITDRTVLSTIGLGQALAQATNNGTQPFDLLFFDQCFQGNLDTLYEVRSAARQFVASPNYAWLVAPYDQYVPLMAPAASSEDIASRIMTRYQRNLNDRHPNVIFSLSQAELEQIASDVSSLGLALRRSVRGGVTRPIGEATRNSQYVDTTQCGRQNLQLGPPDELIGLGTFASSLQNEFPANDRFGVNAAASRVLGTLDQVRKRVRTGAPYIAPDETWNYSDTLTILAPLPPNSPAAIIWRSSIYTETVPLTATWTPSPTLAAQVTASFAYVRDGSWDEFLAEWYGHQISPIIGEWCSYTPPAIVSETDEELLSLSATIVASSTVRLTWTSTTQEDTSAYVIYAKGPFDIALVTQEIIPPGSTTTNLVGLEPAATYTFQVAAQDAAGLTLAQSVPVTLTLDQPKVYLPFLTR